MIFLRYYLRPLDRSIGQLFWSRMIEMLLEQMCVSQLRYIDRSLLNHLQTTTTDTTCESDVPPLNSSHNMRESLPRVLRSYGHMKVCLTYRSVRCSALQPRLRSILLIALMLPSSRYVFYLTHSLQTSSSLDIFLD